MSSKELPNYETVIEIFIKTIELTKNSTAESLEKVKNELKSNSKEIELDQIVMLNIIEKHLSK